MSQPQAPYTARPTPQVDALRGLQKFLNTKQMQQLYELMDEVTSHGYGDVTLHFKHGVFSQFVLTRTVLPQKEDM